MSKKKSDRKLVILVTNDDGIKAKGIHSLIEMVKSFGRIVVVAPEEANSGMSHAITIKEPLRLRNHKRTDEVEFYSVNGTPVDCVKLAMNQILRKKPDLIVSGINHGSNASVSVFYSGTMAAAIEGCFYGIPSIGFSLLDYLPEADFTGAIKYGKAIVQNVLEHGLEVGTCLNVNFPAIPEDKIKGVKLCRQNKGTWREEFEKRVDPRGHEYFWLTGYFHNEEPNSTDTDEYFLSKNYATIVPVSVDLTNYRELERMKSMEFNPQTFENAKQIR